MYLKNKKRHDSCGDGRGRGVSTQYVNPSILNLQNKHFKLSQTKPGGFNIVYKLVVLFHQFTKIFNGWN